MIHVVSRCQPSDSLTRVTVAASRRSSSNHWFGTANDSVTDLTSKSSNPSAATSMYWKTSPGGNGTFGLASRRATSTRAPLGRPRTSNDSLRIAIERSANTIWAMPSAENSNAPASNA